MNFERQYQDEYLRCLFADSAVKFDQDPIERLTQEETAILHQPQKIFEAAKSLFAQYAVPGSDSEPIAYTPEVPVKYSDQRRPALSNTSLFVSHIEDRNDIYAVIKKQIAGVDFFSVPIFLFIGQNDKVSILGPGNTPVREREDLAKARILLDLMRKKYQAEVRDLANSVSYSELLHTGDSNFAIPSCLQFYFGGEALGNQYMRFDTGFDYLGNAFEDAIAQYYRVVGDKPNPEVPSQVKLYGVDLLVNGQPKPIGKENLQPLRGLFRELTTFDSDKYTVEQMRKDFIRQQTAN